jgi:hypothetical protein
MRQRQFFRVGQLQRATDLNQLLFDVVQASRVTDGMPVYCSALELESVFTYTKETWRRWASLGLIPGALKFRGRLQIPLKAAVEMMALKGAIVPKEREPEAELEPVREPEPEPVRCVPSTVEFELMR